MRKSLEIPRTHHQRMALAIVLLIASFASTLAITYFSHTSSKYWVVRTQILPGTQINQSDIELRELSLAQSSSAYFSEDQSPLSSIARRFLGEGEVISRSSVTTDLSSPMAVQVPVSVRAVDIPADAAVGESVNLYWVMDSKNEQLFEPEEIVEDVYIKSIDRKGSNFGSDLAVTISVGEHVVKKLLSYTSGGRIIVVRSSG